MECPNCGFTNPPGNKFCGMCGTRLARACSACGFFNPPDFRFCGQCGAPLVQEADRAKLPPPPVLAEVEKEASTPAQPPLAPVELPTHLEGERRLATVILADVTGSTDLLEQIGTEKWVEIMNRVFHILESEIYRFGGEVDQFRGDGLVAFFGATSAHEDDPERAILASLAMQQALKRYAAELTQQESIDLLLRVGINTGEVIVASVGDRQRHSEDTAMGEAIALAARMETAAEPGTVLVSENTHRLVESQFEWQPLGEITVKGVSQPVAVYRPLTPRIDAQRPDPLQAYGLLAPLIGREAEFDTLKTAVESLSAKRGSVVIVVGDEGMGKSHLVTEVRQHLARDRALLAEAGASDPQPGDLALVEPTWFQGRCRSYDQSSPYSMWLDLLRSWLGMREGEPIEETRDRLRRQCEDLWGHRLDDHYPYLATFLSLPLEEAFAEQVKHLSADGLPQPFFRADEAAISAGSGSEVSEGLRQQFFLTIQSWVEAIASQGPLVLAFEDVHWGDGSSLELLKYCLPLCDHYALLWLILFREERASPAWEFHHRVETEYPHRVSTVTLPPLTEDQSCEFIDQMIGPDALPEETRHLIVSKAEGNPYYIVELIQSLSAQGTLVQDGETGQWRTTRSVTSLDLPDTLQSTLLARIDCCLSTEERRVLQLAAVVGPVFWFNVLQALDNGAIPLKGKSLRAHLTAIQRNQLIHERGRVPELGMEYGFNSTLVRDAVYESLLSGQRAACHLQVAEYLEGLLGLEVPAQHWSAMAYHYRQAGKPRKELFYTVQAAEQAKAVYANEEALKLYDRALELLDELESQDSSDTWRYAVRTQRFEVLNGRREVLALMGDFDAMWADAEALLALARQLADDPVWLIDALLEQPGVAYWRSNTNLDEAISMAEQALALAQQVGDQHREMQSLMAIAQQRYWTNDPQAQEFADRALDIARQLGDRRSEVGILVGLGHAYTSIDPQRSIEYLEAALPVSQALDDKGTELDILSLIGIQLENSEDYTRRLRECHDVQLRISREIGHRPAQAQALMFCGQIQGLYLGDYEGGLELLEESLDIWWQGMPGELFPLLRIAQIRTVQGQCDQALAILERASQVEGSRETDIASIGLDLVSAILHTAMGGQQNLRIALELATQNRQAFVDNPQLSQQYQMVAACEACAAHLGLAKTVLDAAEREHHTRQALESSRAALAIYESFGYVRPIECVSEEILYRHSLALTANGQHAEAAEYRQQAYDEMMRKHNLIPANSPFRRSYLENIPLHRDIRAAYTAGSVKTR
jgi:class 3 adenylate cyclase/tetratricopeptide (TPR) repeat protein